MCAADREWRERQVERERERELLDRCYGVDSRSKDASEPSSRRGVETIDAEKRALIEGVMEDARIMKIERLW